MLMVCSIQCLSETESWFIDSLEEWRKAKKIDNFILLGHSLGGYVAVRYALKVCSLSKSQLLNFVPFSVLFLEQVQLVDRLIPSD